MDKNKTSSLEELLLLNNFEIIGTPFRFAEVIWKREGTSWNEAQRKASQLIKANASIEYLEEIRRSMGIQPIATISFPTIETIPQNVSVNQVFDKPSKMVVQKPKSDVFLENYNLLFAFAPELEMELGNLTESSFLSGKSDSNIHGSASLRSIEKDKYGYFLLLEIIDSNSSKNSVLLYLNQSNKNLLVLSCENPSGKFEVYDNIYTRQLVNKHQLKIQNKYLGNQLNQLIENKLSIPTLTVYPIEDVKIIEEEKNIKVEENTEMPIRIDRNAIKKVRIESDTDLLVPVSYLNTQLFKDVDDDEDDDEVVEVDNFENEEEEDLNKEYSALKMAYYDLAKENFFFKDSVFSTMFQQNFKLLRILIPDILDELELRSFTAVFDSEIRTSISYKIHFQRLNNEIISTISEIYHETRAEKEICTFNIFDSKEAVFVINTIGFMGLREEIFVMDKYEVSENNLSGNTALNNFFLTLIYNKYNSTIVDRFQITKIIEDNQSLSVVSQEQTEDEGMSGLGVLATIFSVVGLGVLGYRALK